MATASCSEAFWKFKTQWTESITEQETLYDIACIIMGDVGDIYTHNMVTVKSEDAT